MRQYLGSITDAKLVREACLGVDCVMHVAGLIDVSMFPDRDKLEEINVAGTCLHSKYMENKISERYGNPSPFIKLCCKHFN